MISPFQTSEVSSPVYFFSDFYLLFFFRDTVNSVGVIPRRLPFTTANTAICTFRHAVSLDERRVKFRPSLWKHEEFLSISDQKDAEATNQEKSNGHKDSLQTLEKNCAKSQAKHPDIDEVNGYFILSTSLSKN